jgi:anti-sigma-K factor RskA
MMTKTTASNRSSRSPFIFAPELAFVAVVKAAAVLVVAILVLLVEVGRARREVPEIDSLLAAAVATKDAGVMVLVYEESNVNAMTAVDGNTVNAFPTVLDKAAVPGSPVGKLRGL